MRRCNIVCSLGGGQGLAHNRPQYLRSQRQRRGEAVEMRLTEAWEGTMPVVAECVRLSGACGAGREMDGEAKILE